MKFALRETLDSPSVHKIVETVIVFPSQSCDFITTNGKCLTKGTRTVNTPIVFKESKKHC